MTAIDFEKAFDSLNWNFLHKLERSYPTWKNSSDQVFRHTKDFIYTGLFSFQIKKGLSKK